MVKINNINTQFISDAVQALKNKYKTTDPFELCECLNINLMFRDLGSVKGLYKYYKRNRFIVINSNLDYSEQRIVCAHELGHDRLHSKLIRNAYMYDIQLDDFSLKPEFEANVFSSELLIDDEYILNNQKRYTTFCALANAIGVSEALMRIKCAVMKHRGKNISINIDYDYNIFR